MATTVLTPSQRIALLDWISNPNGSYVVPVSEYCQIQLTLEAVEGGGLLLRFYED